jgi:hypothetical protein
LSCVNRGSANQFCKYGKAKFAFSATPHFSVPSVL